MSFSEKVAEKANVQLPIPAFGDIGKSANDVCTLGRSEELAIPP